MVCVEVRFQVERLPGTHLWTPCLSAAGSFYSCSREGLRGRDLARVSPDQVSDSSACRAAAEKGDTRAFAGGREAMER